MSHSTTLRMGGALLALAALMPLVACTPASGEPQIRLGPSGVTVEEELDDAELSAIDAVDQNERNTEVQITNFTVPGPAAGIAATAPAPTGVNRVGSAEVPVRLYEPSEAAWATLVWAHGGSFVRGTLDWPEADWVATAFAERGIRVVSVDYALASDTVKAPALSNDVGAAVAWAAAEYAGPLIVGGASAGAQLAVIATLEHADRAARGVARAADALILEYPTLHRVQRANPMLAAEAESLPEARRFRADRIAAMYQDYLGTGPEADAVWIAGELPAARLAALPPTVIVNADVDELRTSGEEFAEQLATAGVPVAVTLEPGTVHGYMNRPGESADARAKAVASIERFTSELQKIIAP